MQRSEKQKIPSLTGPKKQLLRIVNQLKEADLEKIANTMAVSVDYVRDLCLELIEDNLINLHRGPDGKYVFTPKDSKLQTSGSHNRIQLEGDIRPQARDAITNRPGLSGKDMDGDAERYSIGEVIGEIKMKADLPSPEQVETALRSNPQSSYKEIEERLTVHTLICPAKGKEVPWHYCSSCPHQKGIDLQMGTVQCSYEFNERRLRMVYGEEDIKALARGDNGEFTDMDLEEIVALPYVRCPSLDRAIPIDRCADCRYQRDGEWQHTSKKSGFVGWVLCGIPSFIEDRNDDSSTVKYGGKEWRSVPLRWK